MTTRAGCQIIKDHAEVLAMWREAMSGCNNVTGNGKAYTLSRLKRENAATSTAGNGPASQQKLTTCWR